MIEIDPGIIDSAELMNRVMKSVIEKNIDPNLYPNLYGDTLSEKPVDPRTLYIDNAINDLQNTMNWLHQNYAIVERPIVCHIPVIGKLVVVIKKIYRRLTRWIFASYYQQQTDMNGAIVETMSQMLELQKMIRQECEEKSGRI